MVQPKFVSLWQPLYWNPFSILGRPNKKHLVETKHALHFCDPFLWAGQCRMNSIFLETTRSDNGLNTWRFRFQSAKKFCLRTCLRFICFFAVPFPCFRRNFHLFLNFRRHIWKKFPIPARMRKRKSERCRPNLVLFCFNENKPSNIHPDEF